MLGGWAFVKEGLLDQTRPWTLLAEDDSTQLVPLIQELSATADVQLLVNQFLQINDAQLVQMREDAAAIFALLVTLIGFVDAVRWLMTDMAGSGAAAAGLTLIPALPNSLLRDALPASPRRRRAPSTRSTWDPIMTSRCGRPIPPCLATTPLRRIQ